MVAAEVAGEIVEFALGETELVEFVAEDGAGGAFDAALELIEIAGDGGLLLERGIGETAAEHVGAGGEVSAGAALVLLAEEIVELTVEARLAGFGVFGDLAEIFEETLAAGGLALEAPGELFALVGVVERLRAAAHLFEIAGELLLFGGEIAGFAAGFAHLFGETAGGLLAHAFAGALKILLRAGAGGEGLGDFAAFELFGGAAHVVARAFELLTGLLGLFAGLHAVDALAGVVEIADHAALFLFEAFQFAADGLAFGFVLGGGERGLEFLEALIEVLLASGEFAEPGEDLQLFAFLGRGRRLGLGFGFVAVLLVAEFELVELVAVALAAAGAGAAAGLRDAGITGLDTQERLVGAAGG